MPPHTADILRKFGADCSGLDRFPRLPFHNKHIDSCTIMAYYVAKKGEMKIFQSERRRNGEYPCVLHHLTSSSEKSAH